MLTDAQIRQFDQDGLLLGGRVLSDAHVEELRGELERVIADKERKDQPQPVLLRNLAATADRPVWQVVNIWYASPAFARLVHLPQVVEEVVQLLRANELRLWHDQIQFKPAEKGGATPWHQDAPAWPPLEPKHEQTTAWIALDDVDESNGCMSMVAGTHKGGVRRTPFAAGYVGPKFDETAQAMRAENLPVRPCPVPKGHVHFHHGLTWHGSPINPSGRPRRAIALHFMTERTWHFGPGQHPCKPFIQVPHQQKIAGDAFPLVWEHGKVLPYDPQRVERVLKMQTAAPVATAPAY